MARKRRRYYPKNSIRNDVTKDKEPVVERTESFDITHSITYTNDGTKREYWIEYLGQLRPVHFVSNYGYEWWIKYNSLGNISDYWDNTGYEEHYRYYKNNIIICTNTLGDKIKKVIERRPNNYITRDLFNQSKCQ